MEVCLLGYLSDEILGSSGRCRLRVVVLWGCTLKSEKVGKLSPN